MFRNKRVYTKRGISLMNEMAKRITEIILRAKVKAEAPGVSTINIFDKSQEKTVLIISLPK